MMDEEAKFVLYVRCLCNNSKRYFRATGKPGHLHSLCPHIKLCKPCLEILNTSIRKEKSKSRGERTNERGLAYSCGILAAVEHIQGAQCALLVRPPERAQ